MDRNKKNANSRRWAERNPEKRLAIKRKYLYGIDNDTVKARIKAQDGKCKICRIGPAEHLDHDHATGKPRGLLCGNCNRALGLFKEDTEVLKNAIFYIKLWKSIPHSKGICLESKT